MTIYSIIGLCLALLSGVFFSSFMLLMENRKKLSITCAILAFVCMVGSLALTPFHQWEIERQHHDFLKEKGKEAAKLGVPPTFSPYQDDEDNIYYASGYIGQKGDSQ